MQVDDATLRKNFESLSTEELLVHRSAGTLTPQAEIVLAEVLAERQSSKPWKPEGNVSSTPDHRAFSLVLREHFLGKRPLWSAFWLIGALGFVATSMVAMVLAELASTAVPLFALVIALTQLALWIGFGTLALASIWRCAYNVRWRVWGHLARAYVIGLGVLPLAIGVVALLLK